MAISILNDSARRATDRHFARFEAEKVLERVRAIDSKARTAGLAALSPADDELVSLGMEVNAEGRVTKNSYGVLNLAWQAAEKPEWPAMIAAEVDEIRRRIREAHGVNLRFIIWAGMGGSIEDKTAYQACGLLKGGPMLYSLDSTDPEKLRAIIEDMQQRAGAPIAKLLPSTLVVGMAMGMTSWEPVVNLEKLTALYRKFGIESASNFIYMTLPGSLLDQFAEPRGYRRITLQPDGDNTTAGRHSAPLTRGTLYPLAFAGRDLKEWIAGTALSEAEIADAFRLASFLQAQAETGRDKVALLMPKSWAPAALWSKQDVEESLGKSEEIGIKLVINEKVNLRQYGSDRVFLAVQRKGEAHPDGEKLTALRHAGHPLAVVTFSAKAPLSRYMQFLHYVVFALGYLRKMNFVTQPSVELYKAITAEIDREATGAGGVMNTAAWKALNAGKRWRGAVACETPESLASAIRKGGFEYGELTFFGDLRYSENGRAMRRVLGNAGQRLFRAKLKMPVDIYEGPAMNHSYHEMVIGHGRCFSIVLLSQKQSRLAAAGYEPDYHMAQFLATRQALEQRNRTVRAILVKDLSPESLETLDEFFEATAAAL